VHPVDRHHSDWIRKCAPEHTRSRRSPPSRKVWGTSYLVLPEAGLYKPIWEYDSKTLAKDLAGHLAYGAGTGAAFLAA
jgi:hypothetical protein